MKAIKLYLSIVTVLLLVAISLGIYVWYTIQKVGSQMRATEIKTEQVVGEKAPPVSESSGEVPIPPSGKSVVIPTSKLPESQQKVLNAVGVTGGSITITPAMIDCGIQALGKQRIDEIVKGSAPSVLESAQLIPCFKP